MGYENNILCKILSGDLSKYEIINMTENNVSNGLKETMSGWIKRDGDFKFLNPVLINAPTGTGKSYFILNELANFAKNNNAGILLLTNRSVLSWQLKIQTIKNLFDISLALDDIDEIVTIGNITISTYQSFCNNIHILPKDIKFVVMDEAHFFYSDAKFNANTCMILRSILNYAAYMQRIYMSATPEEVKPLIAFEEINLINRILNHGDSYSQIAAMSMPRHIQEFVFKPHTKSFDFIDLKFFDEWETIIDKINCSDSKEKWLIFVGNIEDGKHLKSQLKNAIFVEASTKERANTSLIMREKFSEKILISTNVLDNGINFKDDDLKNIVIDSTDKTQIIQMIGRKRRNQNEKVNVYIMNQSKEKISGFKAKTGAKKRFLLNFYNNPSELLYKRWGTLSEAEQALFTIQFVPNSYPLLVQFHANDHALYCYSCAEGRYSELETKFDDIGETAFVREVCNWLGTDFRDDMILNDITQEIKELVANYIREYLNRPINNTLAAEIYENLRNMINPILSQMKIKIYNDNKHTDPGKIKTILKYFDKGYNASKKDNMWTIVYNPENQTDDMADLLDNELISDDIPKTLQ